MNFNKTALIFSAIVIGSVAIGASTFKNALAQEEGNASVINPTSSWAVTKISQGKSEPYCTLVRQYDGGVVLTLGQNLDEEYSIAIDFQKPKFDPENSYALTLQPGPGQLRAYEMMPASPSAMVVRLGWDDSFLAALADSQMLKAELDKQEYNFAFPDFVTGEKDLAACMDALKNPSSTVVTSAEKQEKKPVFTAKKVAKKVETKQPVALTKAEPVKVVSKVTPEKVVTKVAGTLSKKVDSKKLDKMASELSAAQADKNKLEQDLNKERLSRQSLAQDKEKYEELQKVSVKENAALKTSQKQMSEQLKSAAEEKVAVAEEVASLQEQNKTLSIALKQKDAAQQKELDASAKAEMAEMAEKVEALTKQTVEMNAENKALKISMVEKEKQASIPKAIIVPKDDGETVKLKADLTLALDEKNTLLADLADVKTKLAEKETAKPVEDTVSSEEVEALNKELQSAKDSLALKDKELADVAEKNNEVKAEKVAVLQKRVSDLVEENKKYYKDAKMARSEVDNAKIDLGNQTFKKVKNLETKLEAAMADNISLGKQIDDLSRMQDDVSVGLADGDWNLEKATRRYNSSEKEVRRLGRLLEQQRGSFRAEAKELEGMLFDPAVASEEQRKKLADLEMELADAKYQLSKQGGASQERVINRVGRKDSLSPMPRVPADHVERVSSVTNMPPPKVASKALPKPVVVPVSRAPVAASVSSFGQSELQSIISSAGIGASRISSAGASTYRWNARNMSGYAEIVPKSKAGDVVQFAQNYITQQHARCKGDFASVPGNVGGRKSTYEIACIGGNISTSSSLVFFEKDSDVAVIAHQASADDMDAAMDARDKVASQIR